MCFIEKIVISHHSTPKGRHNKPGRPKITHFLERDKYDGNGVDIAQEPTEPEPPKKRGRPSEAVLEARKSHINTTTTAPVIESKKIKQL